MPYNGSGTYNAPSSPGAFNPASTSQQATPAAWNTLLTDLSTALSTAITKDGQTTVSANIPFNNHKLTGVANGTAPTDAVNLSQLATGTFTGADDTGVADAYAIAPTVPITVYAAYQSFQFKAAHTNTTTSTLAVSGLAAKTIKHLDGTDLLAGDILAGELVQVQYDGTNFQLLSATGLRGTVNTWRAAQTFNAASSFAATAAFTAAALNEAKGADIPSATTTDIGAATGNLVHVTGTTTITGLGTVQAGTRRVVVFDGILILTYNAVSLILPTAASITTAAGDTAVFVSEGGGNWRCTDYERATGVPLALGITSLANSLGADVTLNNTANYFTGPTVAQGTVGTWFASGTVSVTDTVVTNAIVDAKLWDGTTVIASARTQVSTLNGMTISLSGVIASPAGNIRISVRDVTSTNGVILFNATGNSKDSTLTVMRIS